MRVRTLKGAFLAVNHVVKKTFKEIVRETRILDNENGILYTDYSVFLVHFTKEFDRTFQKSFPEIANQIFWDEGIKVNKKLIFQFAHIKNNDRRKLSVLFILENGDIFQVSPLSLMGFCEWLNLITEDGGVSYFFPTIFLTRLTGNPTKGEITTRDKLSLVAQINGLDIDEIEQLGELTSSPIRDFDVDWMGEFARALKNIDTRLERIEKQLRRRENGKVSK